MNKTTSLLLGLVIVAGSAISLSSASRDAFHSYITDPQNNWNYNRYAPTERADQIRNQYRVSGEVKTNDFGSEFANETFKPRNYRASYVNRQPSNIATGSDSNLIEVNRPTRTFSAGRIPTAESVEKTFVTESYNARNYRGSYVDRKPAVATAKTVTPNVSTTRVFTESKRASDAWTQYTRRGQISTLNLQEQGVTKFQNYQNDTFSITLPTDLVTSSLDTHSFVSAQSDFQVRVKYFENDVCSTSYGFAGCAIALSEGENYAIVEGRGSLYVTDHLNRSTRTDDTVLSEVNTDTDVHYERFNGQILAGEEKTFDRYFVRDIDGGVFMIETSIPTKQASQFVGITKEVFDTFRVYPLNLR